MAKHRGFQDEFYHDEHLIDMWNRTVHKKDLTFILGDVTMEKSDHYFQLDRLNGRKIVVLGNHDLPKHVPELLKHVESVAGMVDYKGCVLTHAPIHPNEVAFCRLNIHAHIHENKLWEVATSNRYADEGHKIVKTLHKYRCVDAHLIGYKPKTLEELLRDESNMGI